MRPARGFSLVFSSRTAGEVSALCPPAVKEVEGERPMVELRVVAELEGL